MDTKAIQFTSNINNNQKQVLFNKISEIIDNFGIKSVLDIGAGHSDLALPISKKIEKYTGIEIRQDRAKQLKEAGLNVIEGVFPDIKISDTYDLVLSSHSIPEQVENYYLFLTRAWDLVKKNGLLVIITFKGVKDDLEDLINELRVGWTNSDMQKHNEMVKILSTFGKINTEKIISYSSSEDIEQITDLLSFSIGGTDEEKRTYRTKLRDILKKKYKINDRYIFPHKHLVFLIQKP